MPMAAVHLVYDPCLGGLLRRRSLSFYGSCAFAAWPPWARPDSPQNGEKLPYAGPPWRHMSCERRQPKNVCDPYTVTDQPKNPIFPEHWWSSAFSVSRFPTFSRSRDSGLRKLYSRESRDPGITSSPLTAAYKLHFQSPPLIRQGATLPWQDLMIILLRIS